MSHLYSSQSLTLTLSKLLH